MQFHKQRKLHEKSMIVIFHIWKLYDKQFNQKKLIFENLIFFKIFGLCL